MFRFAFEHTGNVRLTDWKTEHRLLIIMMMMMMMMIMIMIMIMMMIMMIMSTACS